MIALYSIIWLGITLYLLSQDKDKEAGIVFGGGILLLFILSGANFA